MDRSALGVQLMKRAKSLWDKRASVFDSPAQEISQYFWPDVSDINQEKTESTTGWFDRIFEATGIRASATCSIGVRNWVTPSTDPWLGLAPPSQLRNRALQDNSPAGRRVARLQQPQEDPADNDGQDEATKFLASSAEEMMGALSSSSFYSVVQPFNRSACVFGTALMFCEEGKDELLRFEQFKYGTYAIAENDQKIVDTVFRWFKLTNRQAEQRWGKENLPKRIRDGLKANKLDEMNTYVHCVFPNSEYKGGMIGPPGMRVASVYVTEMDKWVVDAGGFEEMPYFCLRWSRWGTDDQPYGCSPAYECLPEARQLNFITQFSDALVELQAFPRFLIPDSSDGMVQLAAGAETIVKADDMVRGAVPKEWMTQGRMESIDEMTAKKVKAIQDAFFVSIFTALGDLGDKIASSTLGAIALLQGEKLDQFTGTFDQYVTELINPLVRRVMGIMLRGGWLGKPPQALMVQPGNDPKADPEFAAPKVVIQSRVTLAIKQVRTVGMQKTLEGLQPVFEARPETLDVFDLEEWCRTFGRANGVPETVIRKVKDLITMRQQRQQMIAAQQALEQAKTASEAAKNLGKAPQQMQDQVAGQLEQFPQAAGQ